jgi:hypothetical protein
MRAFPIALTLAAILVLPSAATAQRERYDSPVAGDSTCRAIWRQYGRTMSGRARAVYCEEREIGTRPRSELIDVDGGFRGGVSIKGAQRNDVRVRLVIQAQGDDVADARELARRVTLDLSRSTLSPDIPRIDNDDWRRDRRFVAATIVIDAPVESNVRAHVEHAPMDIENVRGRIDVRGEHGPVDLRDIGGDVRARVAHGPLSVTLSGKQFQGTGLDLFAQHGPLTVRLPRDFNADLEIGAEHGPLDVDFPITLTRFDRSSIQTKLGAGGPRIRAIAQHGPMSLRMER